jgi:hypothetical protein
MILCSWLLVSSFLSGRSQVTIFVYNKAKSDTLLVLIGVPHGSILGPLLFVTYVNDIPNILETCQVTLFADDTVLYCSSKCSAALQQKLNSELHQHQNVQIHAYWQSKRLARLSSSLVVSIGNVPLEEVQSYKYLGVMINNNLTWHEHIDHIKSEVN